MKGVYSDLIYLLSCAVNGITPDKARVQAMDLETLYKLAKFYTVRGAVCIALKRAGVQDKQFDQAYKKTVRKIIYLDMERAAIISDFEKQGIWYMPLKGSVLKELYPENGMREMSDNDVLIDAEKQEQVKEIMLAHGYTAKYYGVGNHDVYMKPPVLNFEMHTSLFGEAHAEPLYKYYADVKRLLVKNEGSEYGCHFFDEDLYVYVTAHEWKHFSSSGAGLRPLMDRYVFLKNKGDTLDWGYITEQTKQLEIADYELERRQLAVKVFSSDKLPKLTESEQQTLINCLTSGTYGTIENSIRKKLHGRTKAGFILSNMFPNLEYMKRSVKFVGACPLMYPIGIVYRWGRIITKRRSYLKQTIKTVRKYGK